MKRQDRTLSREIVWALPVLLVLFILFLGRGVLLSTYSSSQGVYAVKGRLDASAVDFSTAKPLFLGGEWSFYPNLLLTPACLLTKEYPPSFVTVPSVLGPKDQETLGFGGYGYATLALTIHTKEQGEEYGLRFRHFSSAHRVWIGGREMKHMGQVATNKEEFFPRHLPSEIYFFDDTGTIEVVVQIANFDHRRIHLFEVLLTTREQLVGVTRARLIANGLFFGSLMCISLYYFLLFFLRGGSPLLYLAAISLVTGLRIAVIKERFILYLLPGVSSEIMMKMGYLSAFVLLPLFIIYVQEMFPVPKLQLVARFAKGLLVFFTLFVLFTPLRVYDQAFSYAPYVLVPGGLYLLFLIVFLAVKKREPGSLLLVIGGVFLLLATLNDLLRDRGLSRIPELVSSVMVGFVLSQALFLSWRFLAAYLQTTRLALEYGYTMTDQRQSVEQWDHLKVLRKKELLQVRALLSTLSKTDAQTGVANKEHFAKRLQEAWEESQAKKRELALIYLQLDSFETYRAQFGEKAGELCLRRVAQALMGTLRQEKDLLARYQDEEFLVVLPLTSKATAFSVAEKLRLRVEELRLPHLRSTVVPFVTLSLGVASTIASTKKDPASFLAEAREALKQAKKAGGNRIAEHEPWSAHPSP